MQGGGYEKREETCKRIQEMGMKRRVCHRSTCDGKKHRASTTPEGTIMAEVYDKDTSEAKKRKSQYHYYHAKRILEFRTVLSVPRSLYVPLP